MCNVYWPIAAQQTFAPYQRRQPGSSGGLVHLPVPTSIYNIYNPIYVLYIYLLYLYHFTYMVMHPYYIYNKLIKPGTGGDLVTWPPTVAQKTNLVWVFQQSGTGDKITAVFAVIFTGRILLHLHGRTLLLSESKISRTIHQ